MPGTASNGAGNLQQQIAQMRADIADMQDMLSAQASAGGPAQIPSYPNKLIVPFTYIVTFNNIAAGAVVNAPIQMAADSVFELLRTPCVTSADLSTDFAPNNIAIQLTDGSTGQLLSSATVPQAMLCSRSYQIGNDEKYPIQFPALAQVQVAVTNLLAIPLVLVTFGLRGYKIFQKGP
jgi:hypothetical protein